MSAITITLGTSEPLGDLVKELSQFDKKLNRAIARQVVPVLERDLERSVQVQLRNRIPPPRGAGSPPFVWSLDPVKNERGRRGFFARYPNGFKRTGELPRSWNSSIEFAVSSGVLVFGIENPSEGASYVYGSEEFGYAQVPGHEGRWLNAGEVVSDILLEVAARAESQLTALVDEALEAL